MTAGLINVICSHVHTWVFGQKQPQPLVVVYDDDHSIDFDTVHAVMISHGIYKMLCELMILIRYNSNDELCMGAMVSLTRCRRLFRRSDGANLWCTSPEKMDQNNYYTE